MDSESNDYTKQLILNGNPTDISIGESVWLQPGVRAVDYGPNEMGKFINQTVVLPVVAPAYLDDKDFCANKRILSPFTSPATLKAASMSRDILTRTMSLPIPKRVTGKPANPYSTPSAPQLVN